MCEEYPELKDSVQSQVEEAAQLMVEMELKFIDKMFEMGDLENLKKYDLKNFIIRRANEKLMELGYLPIFEYDNKSADKLDWFYHLTGGVTHTDFFAIRPTDYSKAGENENWDEDALFD
jgi:ribonucleoside-diphosphate reductase beta chain